MNYLLMLLEMGVYMLSWVINIFGVSLVIILSYVIGRYEGMRMGREALKAKFYDGIMAQQDADDLDDVELELDKDTPHGV